MSDINSPTDAEATAGILSVLRGQADPRFGPMLLMEFEERFAEDRELVLSVTRKLIDLGASEDLIMGFVEAAMGVGRLGFGIELFQAVVGAPAGVDKARH